MADPRFLRRQTPNAGVVTSAARELQANLGYSVRVGLANGIEEVGRDITNAVKAMGELLAADRMQAPRLRTNQALAVGAAEAVARRYNTRTPRRPNPRYRVGENRLAGVLGDVLADIGAMTSGTTRDRINFAETDVLDTQAPHWRRLNFGAGPNAGKKPKPYRIDFDGKTVSVLQFPDLVRPAARFPTGRWFPTGAGGPGGGGEPVRPGASRRDEFYPGSGRTGGRIAFKSVSIAATQFLDAGNLYLGQKTGRAYLQMLGTEVSDAARRSRLQQGTKVRIPADFRRITTTTGGGAYGR